MIYRFSKNYFYLILTLLVIHNYSSAQDVVESIDNNISMQRGNEMFVETIKLISSSRRIFILTNGNEMLAKGDFITMAKDNKACARALVAKEKEQLVGIKILKIYSLACWAQIKRNLDVQIMRGDDSTLFVKKVAKKESKSKNKSIDSEEDLYNSDVTLEDDVSFDDMGNRHIKPDNLVSLTWGQRRVNDLNNDLRVGNEFSGQWGYQLADNIWAEGNIGITRFNDFPANQATSIITNLTGRLKYTIKLPFYTYALPYIGYQTYSISSNAGKTNNNATNEKELEHINKLKTSQVAIGMSILHRLVPGWFVKADLGTDTMNLGVSIEF
jgi:hypothetical protein